MTTHKHNINQQQYASIATSLIMKPRLSTRYLQATFKGEMMD